jgi:hypothetical protein
LKLNTETSCQKFSTNNLLDKKEKKSRYAGLQVDQLEEIRNKNKLRTLAQRRETAPLPDQDIGALPEHKEI